MAENTSLTQVIQLGMENTTTPGSTVAATTRLQTMKIDTGIKTSIALFRPSGDKFSTVAAPNKEWGEAKVTGQPSFGELPYMFASIMGSSTPTPQGPNGAQTWVFDIKPLLADTPQTYTIEDGNAVRARQWAYGLFTAAGLKITRDKLDLSGSLMMQQVSDNFVLTPLAATTELQTVTITGSPTGGTFTLSFLGVASAAIAHDAVGATVQAALVAVSTIGAGGVTVTGSAGGPYTVTFAGSLAKQFVPLLVATPSFTGGTTPAMTVVVATAGVSTTPEPVINPVIPTQVSVYIDATAAALGTTRMLRAFEADWNIDNRFGPVWPLNQAITGFAAQVEVEPKPMTHLLMEVNAQGMAYLPTMRAGSTIFVRFEALGPLIDGTVNYKLWIDQAIKLNNVSEFKDQGGVYALEWDGQMVHDYVWGHGCLVTLVNQQPAL